MKNRNQTFIGILCGFISALCVAGYFSVNKYVYTHYSISAVEYTLLFAVVGGVYGLVSLMFKFNHKTYATIRSNAGSLALLGVAVAIAMGMLVFGQRYTTSVNAAIIITSSIVATAFYSYILLKERLSKKQLIWSAVLFMGLYIGIVGFNTLQLRLGDLIILGSVVFFGFGNAFSRVIMRRIDKPSIVPYTRLIIGGLIGLLAAVLLVHNYSIWKAVLPLAVVGAGFYWLCMITFAKSVHLLNANEAVIINQSQIFFTSLAGVFILSEPYTIEKFIGSVIVITSIYFITAHKRVLTA
jgi:drug/metabolite transporter (DMT)-like permease